MNFLDLFPTIDLFILFLFIAGIILNWIFIKKEKLFLDFLCLYFAFILVIVLPIFSTTVLNWFFSHPYFRLIAFLAVKFGILFILFKSNLGEFSKKASPTQSSVEIMYRIGLMGLFFTAIIYFLPDSVKQSFGNLTNILFNNLIVMIFWFALPLFFVFAFKFKTRRGWIE